MVFFELKYFKKWIREVFKKILKSDFYLFGISPPPLESNKNIFYSFGY